MDQLDLCSSSSRMGLSVFHPNNRRLWSIPEFRDDEDTLLITDSDGRTLLQMTPPTWWVVAYHGGRIDDATKLLSDAPLPLSIRNIVLFIGLNDRTIAGKPLVNITRLQEVLAVQTCRVVLCTLPHFTNESTLDTANCCMSPYRPVHRILNAEAPSWGELGGQAPSLEKIRVGMAHPGNFSRGLKTSWQ